MIGFFNPTDILGIGGDWVIQKNTPKVSKDRAPELKANGDESYAVGYNERTTLTSVYKCSKTSGVLVIPKLGKVLNSYHVDSVRIDFMLGLPQMTVVSHKHAGALTHVDADCTKFTGLAILPAEWGIPTSLSGVFALSDLLLTVKSLSYQIALTHVDELDYKTGGWKAGASRDGVETVDIEIVGTTTDETFAVTAGWHKTSRDNDTANTASENERWSLERHVARD